MVKAKHWKLHDLEVDHEVPKHDFVILDERLLRQDLIFLFCKGVDKLFVQDYGREQWKRKSLPTIDVLCAVLALYEELWNETLFAIWAGNRIVRQRLRKLAE